MKEFSQSTISSLSIHQIGPEVDAIQISEKPVKLGPEDTSRMAEVLLKGINLDARYQFSDTGQDSDAVIKNLVEAFFHQKQDFHDLTVDLAKEWIRTQPENLKFREMIVCEFMNLNILGKNSTGIGIFLTHSRENFLRIQKTPNDFSVFLNEGVNLKKLSDCVLLIPGIGNQPAGIFFKQNMYDFESHHLVDHFLHIKPVSNNFYQTSHQLNILKAYVDRELDDEEPLEKIDKMNRSMEYFKKHDHFDQKDFESAIFDEAEQKTAFERFRHQYATEKDLEILDEFDIVPNAVKKKIHYVRSVIKLDKNFHIYVHGNRQNIIRGFDPERGKHFYQLFFDEEM